MDGGAAPAWGVIQRDGAGESPGDGGALFQVQASDLLFRLCWICRVIHRMGKDYSAGVLPGVLLVPVAPNLQGRKRFGAGIRRGISAIQSKHVGVSKRQFLFGTLLVEFILN